MRALTKEQKVKKAIKDKEWFTKNKAKVNEYKRIYKANRIKTDPNFKLLNLLRSRLYHSFKASQWIKSNKRENLLGADITTVKTHIESLFTDGMNWNNMGEWHIDHILPIGKCESLEEMVNRCHYKNLQPLWAIDNLKKSCSLNTNIK
jgi:hypothetical protein